LKIYQAIIRSWHLLSKKQKSNFILSAFAQSALNILDLVGVLSLTLTTYLLVNGNLPKNKLFESISNLNSSFSAAAFIAITIFLFTLKGLLAPIFLSNFMSYLTKISIQISHELTKKFFSKPITFLQKYSSQKSLFALSQGVTAAVNEILGSFLILIAELFLLCLLISTMIFTNWILALINVLLFTFTILVLNSTIGKKQYSNTRVRIESIMKGNSLLVDMINSYRELLVSKKFNFFLEEFVDQRSIESKASSNGLVLNSLPKYIFEIIFYLGAGVILYFSYMFVDRSAAFSLFVLFIASGSRILPSILRIQASLANIRSNEALSNHTFSLMNDLNEFDNFLTPAKKFNVDSERSYLLKIENLKFSYPNKPEWKLDIPNLMIQPNIKVGLVGQSGSGKSTLLDLILGVLVPNEGRIQLSDRVKIQNRNLIDTRIAYMPQRISIMNRTLRENVALGVQPNEINDNLVNECLDKSGMSEFIKSLSFGIHEILNEDGSNLSGGQKQRIGFARILYQKPNVLLLDEFTSSLDSESESLIAKTIKMLGTNISLISIAHRLSTVKDYDLIIYMENGRILYSGSFKEVRAKSESFDYQARLMGL
jgi:ABC-type bacteriocin/lantibiotic exporter with double-glycine peptidase domain